jgi:hypothetical protein
MLVSLFFPIAGLIWYFFSLEGRISTLEDRVKVLIAAPSSLKDDSKSKKEESGGITIDTASSPLIETCKELYAKVEKAIEANEINARITLNGYMSELDCAGALNPNRTKK